MKKRTPARGMPATRGPDLFTKLEIRRCRQLILPRFLAEEAAKAFYRGKDQDRAFAMVKKWAELEKQGHLFRKETALDADFLLEIFGDALAYTPATKSPAKYYLERNFAVPGVGTADGALGSRCRVGRADFGRF